MSVHSSAVVIRGPSALGRAILQRRSELKLTRQHVSDMTGISRRTLIHLEEGKATLQLSKALEVIAALGLTLTLGSGS